MSHDDCCVITDTEPVSDKPDGYIISVEKDGYTRNGHLLRRAEVIIVKNQKALKIDITARNPTTTN